MNLISSVAVGPNSEIVIADTKVQAFSAKGDFMETIFDEGKGKRFFKKMEDFYIAIITGKGRYGGIVVDPSNRILASRSEQKGRNYLQVLSLTDSSVNNMIDSHDQKLKRPSGIAITSDNYVIVVDLGNNCIKKYRYW